MNRPTRADWIRWSIAAAILALAFALLPRLEPRAHRATAAAATADAVAKLGKEVVEQRPDLGPTFPVSLFLDGKEARDAGDALRAQIRASSTLQLRASGRPIHVVVEPQNDRSIKVGLGWDEGSVQPVVVWATRQPIVVWSVLVPVLALALALATRRLSLSLLVAVVIAGGLAVGGNPLAIVAHVARSYAWKATLLDPARLAVAAVVAVLAFRAGTGRRAVAVARGIATLALALAFFAGFDDLGTAHLVAGALGDGVPTALLPLGSLVIAALLALPASAIRGWRGAGARAAGSAAPASPQR